MQESASKTKKFNDLPVNTKLGIPLWITGGSIALGLLANLYQIFQAPDSTFFLWTFVLGSIGLASLVFGWLILQQSITKPLTELKEASEAIAEGDLEFDLAIATQDEIGSIAHSTRNLSSSIRKARQFARDIGEGNYDLDNLTSSTDAHKDSLFLALMGMRDQLKNVAEQDRKRNWVTKGMAEFSQILRANDTDLHQLGAKIITALVRYVNASQGGIFVLNNENTEFTHLELIACYAYDEVKYLEKKIILNDEFAEGLVGQAFLEEETIYLTDVPQEYVQIASGLGGSNPRSILIVPLSLNGKVEGVIEIASFYKIEKHEIEFLERLAENIASAIISLKANENTKRLLRDAQELTRKLQTRENELRQNYEELQATQEVVKKNNDLIEEQKKALEKALVEQTEKSEMLQAQEEEMRQNMEELVATQEQMMITQSELDGQLNAINNSTISKIEFNIDGTIVSANQSFCDLFGYTLKEIKGKPHQLFWDINEVETQEYGRFWQTLQKGILQAGVFKRISKNNEVIWLNSVYSPVLNRKGEPYKIIKLAFDITESKRLLEETQIQAKILQAQEEELRQNMEELKSTQDELNAKNEAIILLKEEEAQNAQIKAKEIESKNQLITSSIQYAQNIQRSILPAIDKMLEQVQDCFVIYLPKDIVSGDFYWFSHIENKSFFAVVDCTGHGVPGAFMSIIGNTILNEIINVQKIFDTGTILEKLHEGVRSRLRQDREDNDNYDGMDLVICMLENLDSQQVKVHFSGAKRSLFYYEMSQAQSTNALDLVELKGERKSIGGWQQEVHRTFEKTELILKKGDLLYLTTDGLMDSPNFQRKKFGVDRFKKIILENLHRPMRQQRSLILGEMAVHQQGAEQRDDITVMGIKL
ncbi:MAG: SpoIIE family protein phosphatase [Microscillaceae bacterium]|jgi:PAS domain S-box-containing protein|nr:SpoIIE family protein phosphatase [Microscillaceae bacterium]